MAWFEFVPLKSDHVLGQSKIVEKSEIQKEIQIWCELDAEKDFKKKENIKKNDSAPTELKANLQEQGKN